MISLPPAFTERMQQLLGNESETFFPSVSFGVPHFHPVKPEKTANTDLPFSELLSRQVPWCSNGYYLKERPSFTSDPLLHGGAYYVQEASSMFLQVVLQQITGDTPSGFSTYVRLRVVNPRYWQTTCPKIHCWSPTK